MKKHTNRLASKPIENIMPACNKNNNKISVCNACTTQQRDPLRLENKRNLAHGMGAIAGDDEDA